MVKKLIEKIEGEAELDFTFDAEGMVSDGDIVFGFYRGVEEILQQKAPRDALVITPRVCGICNHAHLLAAVHALEDGYQNAGIEVALTHKATSIRQFTQACELVQNHVKWLYLTVIPQLEALSKQERVENPLLKATYLSSTITKALAIFAGQWPHSSYAIPGGVTCDPTYVDVMQAQALVEESIRFFEQVMTGIPFDTYMKIDSVSDMHRIQADASEMLQMLGESGLGEKGRSHDRFIVFGEGLGMRSGKSLVTSVSNVDVRYVAETPQPHSTAKAVTYKKRLYETGPIARAMVNKTPIIKSLHKRYKDALVTRIFARFHETALLLAQARSLLASLNLSEDSCTLKSHLLADTFEGVGMIEAARGSLIHKTYVKSGKIEKYDIIVPTQWNLSLGTKEERGIAVKAMIGSSSIEEATFIFRSFDVCSVCTTQ